jgi:myo-inositol 2-dehydrogenase/D-chiro-inositol 1-dehydrogenase
MTRYGILGCGAWGRHYAAAIQKNPRLELVAVADAAHDTVEALRKDFPDAQVTREYNDVVSANVDVVAVVSPNYLHHEHGMAVLRAGKHLLIEKPFGLSITECDDMILLAKEKNLQLVVGHQFRLSSLWGLIKKMIDDDYIGEPRYSLVELSRNPYRLGADGWRYDLQRVGDWIAEEPIHFLDLAVWYFEKFAKPVSIHASANSTDTDRPELQDNVSATIEFSNGSSNGSFAVVAQTLSMFEHHQLVKIAGTKGSLWASWDGAMDRTLHPTFSLKAFDGKEVKEIPIEKITGELFELEDQLDRMADIVAGKVAVHCTGEDGKRAVQLSAATLESAKRKQPITL